jgi:xanthine dehydrogenase large subunit
MQILSRNRLTKGSHAVGECRMNAIAPPSAGRPIAHDSAAKHVSGEALYIDDLPEPAGLLHAYIRLSPHAHARITRLDVSQVASMPGVAAVMTAADIPGVNDVGPAFPGDPIFAGGLVEYHGQSIFAVAAGSIALAREAAAKAVIEYDVLPPILTIDEALAAKSTVLPTQIMQRGNAEAALARAPLRLTGRIDVGGQEHFYLEGQVAMAIPGEDGDMFVHSSTQHPTEVQHLVARALKLSHHSVVCETRRMGGGFGGKESQASLIACVAALLAQRTKRPVKLAARPRRRHDADRQKARIPHRLRCRIRCRWAHPGISFMQAARCGYSPDLSGAICDRAMFHADNCYYLDHARIVSYRCKTNTVSNTAFRGFGGPQGMMGIECVVDDIARHLGIDPLLVRQRNFYGTTERNVTPYHMTVEDNIIPELVAELAASARYAERRAEIAAFNAENPWIKRGLALTPIKFGISFTLTHMNQAGALVHVYTDGSVMLNHGGTEMGQGLYMKVAQVVATEFGLSVDRVKITATTTAKVPNTSPTAASSGSDLNGKAAQAAAVAIRERMAVVAAKELGVAAGGHHVRRRQSRCAAAAELSFAEVAKLTHRARVQLSSDRLLRDAEAPLRHGEASGPAVLLFRLWRRGRRGRDRHADRRIPAAARRHPARLRAIAEPGARPRADRGRFRAGHGLADHRGTVVGRGGPSAHPRAVDLQNPGLRRHAGGVQRPSTPRDATRGRHLPLQSGRRAAVDAGHRRVPRAEGCGRLGQRRRRRASVRCTGDTGTRSHGSGGVTCAARRDHRESSRVMHAWLRALNELERDGEPSVLVTVVTARGSTPTRGRLQDGRHGDTQYDTIGGGNLEFTCVEAARKMLDGTGGPVMRDFPLGPALGQCCGGHVSVLFEPLRTGGLLARRAVRRRPCRARSDRIAGESEASRHLVDTRADALAGSRLVSMRATRPIRRRRGVAAGRLDPVLVMTHDHQIDFDIVAAAMTRADFAGRRPDRFSDQTCSLRPPSGASWRAARSRRTADLSDRRRPARAASCPPRSPSRSRRKSCKFSNKRGKSMAADKRDNRARLVHSANADCPDCGLRRRRRAPGGQKHDAGRSHAPRHRAVAGNDAIRQRRAVRRRGRARRQDHRRGVQSGHLHNDPTAHAEVVAIRLACQALGRSI